MRLLKKMNKESMLQTITPVEFDSIAKNWHATKILAIIKTFTETPFKKILYVAEVKK